MNFEKGRECKIIATNMKYNTAYKFRIYPTDSQKEYIDDCFRASNFVFNFFLRQQIDISEKMDEMGIEEKDDRKNYMRENDLYFNAYKASKELTEMGNTDEYSFLKNGDATLKTYALRRLDNAFKNMKKIGSGFPKFKKNSLHKSFTGQIQYSKNTPKSFKILNDSSSKRKFVKIPKIKNPIEIIIHREDFLNNWNNLDLIKINSYSISCKNNKYFISFQLEYNDLDAIEPIKKEILPETSIGIDRGVKRPITTSDTEDFQSVNFSNAVNLIYQYKSEIKKLNSILNKKRDFHKKNKSEIKFYETSSYKRIKNKLNKVYFKMSEKRNYIHHLITSELVNKENVDTFILEDLKIKNMTKKSAKGKSNNKKGLNRVMLDTGFGEIKTQLQYKAERKGKNVVFVNPAYTSLMCSECGHIEKDNRKTQIRFECNSCGHIMNADLNAAINIKNNFFREKSLEIQNS